MVGCRSAARPHNLIRGEIVKSRVMRDPVVQPQDQSIRYIPLTQGKIAIVDAADYEWLSQWNWYAQRSKRTFYAVRVEKQKPVFMQNELFSQYSLALADHKDGNGLNNRRENLRSANTKQNRWNSCATSRNLSGLKGVSPKGGRWQARINVDGRVRSLGCFDTAKQAAEVYDAEVLRLRGNFARLNFPPKAV